MPITVTPSGEALGARIDGVDLSQPLTSDQKSFIEKVFLDYLVIAISGNPYGQHELTQFGELFGDLEISAAKSYHDQQFPHVNILSNIVIDGKPLGSPDAGQVWHTDMSYNCISGRATILHAHKVPSRDGQSLGNTQFRNMHRAYKALPISIRERIDKLEAVHSFEKVWQDMIAKGSKRPAFTEDQRRQKPAVVHPVVLLHPWTGKRALYVNRGMTESIVGMDKKEGETLLSLIIEHTEKKEFGYSHKWRTGDTLIWDNCASIHTATADYDRTMPRHMYRVQVLGNEELYRQRNILLGGRFHLHA